MKNLNVFAFCQIQSLLNHLKSYFNPTKQQNTPTELSSDDLPHFVTQLRQISATTNIKSKPPDIDEITQQITKLKVNKAFNDIDPALIKRLDHPIMLQVIHRMSTNLWENLDVPTA